MTYQTGSLRFYAPQFRVVRKRIKGRTLTAAVLHDRNVLVAHSSEHHYSRKPLGSILDLLDSLTNADSYLFFPYVGAGSLKVAGIFPDSTQCLSDEEYLALTNEEEEEEQGNEMVELNDEQMSYLLSLMRDPESSCNEDESMVD
jgi:hypothetical protein